MELVALTEYLVKSVAVEKDDVRVKLFDEEDNTLVIQVLVNESDMGRVIGKKGSIASSIRTIVQASSYLNGNKLIRINIDAF